MAIEALPTSNLRISYYRDFHEHHLFRWLGLAPDTHLSVKPDIVVGTDDTGFRHESEDRVRADRRHIAATLQSSGT
jgi:hypothetical protein